MKLKNNILLDYKNYILQDFQESRKVSILGDKYTFEQKFISEIMEELMDDYLNGSNWFQLSITKLQRWITRAFLTKQYSIDDINYFFNNFINDQIINSLANSESGKDGIFDNVHDLYIKVLTELKYQY